MLVFARWLALHDHHVGRFTKVPIERERYNPVAVFPTLVGVPIDLAEMLNLAKTVAVRHFERNQRPERFE